MNRIASIAMSVMLVLGACAARLQADTTVFENGFYFISEPTEFEDVVVGEGAIVAFLGGVVITGDLEVVDGGFVSANDCVIEGDVKADRAAIVDLLRVDVGGDVQIKRTGGQAVLGLLPAISIIQSDIYGDVKITNNRVNSITVTENLIGGKLQIQNNRSTFTNISNNSVNLNRHCRNK